MVSLFYTTCISEDLAHHEIFHAKVGKCGKMTLISLLSQLLSEDCCLQAVTKKLIL